MITLSAVVNHSGPFLEGVILSGGASAAADARSRRTPIFVMRSPRQHRYSVYILGSITGTLYVGVTGNLQFRVRQHKDHTFRGFTAEYEVNRLLYYETFGEVITAIKREKQLKGWRLEKKIALIETMNPQWRDLSKGWYDKPVRQTFGW